MKLKLPPVKKGIPLVDAAIATGQYNICPELSKSEPDITNPLDNPDRKDNVSHWNPKTFSFMLPDGAAVFCERLQGNDPMSQFGYDPIGELDDWTKGFGDEAE